MRLFIPRPKKTRPQWLAECSAPWRALMSTIRHSPAEVAAESCVCKATAVRIMSGRAPGGRRVDGKIIAAILRLRGENARWELMGGERMHMYRLHKGESNDPHRRPFDQTSQYACCRLCPPERQAKVQRRLEEQATRAIALLESGHLAQWDAVEPKTGATVAQGLFGLLQGLHQHGLGSLAHQVLPDPMRQDLVLTNRWPAFREALSSSVGTRASRLDDSFGQAA